MAYDLVMYEPPPLAEEDVRDWLRHEMVAWPYVTERTRRFLDALHWRQRGSVTLTLGAGMAQEDAAFKLGVSRATVQRDIAAVVALAEGWATKDAAQDVDQ